VRSVLVCLVVAGCSCDDGRPTRAGDAGSVPGIDVGPRPSVDAGGSDDCNSRARWVYLVDDSSVLLRFEPDSLTFSAIGSLDCPSFATPFSMSVDRHAVAWVLYQDGALFHASTRDASCAETSFEPNQAGFDLFGMGFVGDGVGGETLFVAGGDDGGIGLGSARLAAVDTTTLRLTPRGDTLQGWPELTGTGDGQLWAFFPDTLPPSAAQLDTSTGATLRSHDLSALPPSSPSAWAFAFWGGRYYVFLQSSGDASTNVYRMDPDGSSSLVLSDTGYRIVGAGVSTCAPVELI